MTLPRRVGTWTKTLPFSINHDGLPVHADQTESFPLPFTTTVPMITEFNPFGADPSGSRHLTTHPSFIKVLASGVGNATLDFRSFDLQATDISRGSGVSKTKLMLFRINAFYLASIF